MMGAIWLALHADLRRRWRPVLALALLLGVTGGVVLTAAAGARRTDTAYPRLLRSTQAAQLQLITGGYTQHGFIAQLRRLPEVMSVSEASLYDALLPVPHGRPSAPVEAFSSQDDSFGITADRVKVLSGRRFSPADPRAAMVDQQLAAREHLSPGSVLRLVVVPGGGQGPDWPGARMVSFRVSAIVVFASQIVPVTQDDAEPAALLSPAFSHTRLALSASYGTQAGVRLRPGAGPAAFLAAARTLARHYPAAGPMSVVSLAGEVSATQRAIRPEAVTLGLFAGLTAVIALAVLGQFRCTAAATSPCWRAARRSGPTR
jgi:hypothetical protein